MTRIPFQDLTRLHNSIRVELDDAIARVVDNSAFVGGSEVAAFEEEFAAAHGVEVAGAGCGSGTDALALALRALGVGPGDEVIVPAMTFVATVEAVVHVGATPVLVDVDPVTLLIDPLAVAAARTDRTRAVVPVHLYGHVVPFDVLQGWRDDGLLVIEDAAQAHLATWEGTSVGSVGHAAGFSFYPGKNLGALGDGGFVLSRDAAVVGEVRRLRDHGRAGKYDHDTVGWCSRLDGIQAAVLGVKLRHLGEWTEARRAIAQRYHERLGEVLVPWTEGSVHHLLVARVDGAQREAIRTALSTNEIATGVHYPVSLSRMKSLEAWWSECPHAESAADEVLSLPMDPLMSTDEVDIVAEVLRSC